MFVEFDNRSSGIDKKYGYAQIQNGRKNVIDDDTSLQLLSRNEECENEKTHDQLMWNFTNFVELDRPSHQKWKSVTIRRETRKQQSKLSYFHLNCKFKVKI